MKTLKTIQIRIRDNEKILLRKIEAYKEKYDIKTYSKAFKTALYMLEVFEARAERLERENEYKTLHIKRLQEEITELKKNRHEKN